MESWKRKLRMGMVGGGPGAFIGGVHRIAATLDQQVELVAGCFSQIPKNTKITGEQLYLAPPRCYGTYGEMAEAEASLSEDERIDFVSIVTPNVSHHAIAKTFLEAGFHVVCDKPMTYNLSEAKNLVNLVEESGAAFPSSISVRISKSSPRMPSSRLPSFVNLWSCQECACRWMPSISRTG